MENFNLVRTKEKSEGNIEVRLNELYDEVSRKLKNIVTTEDYRKERGDILILLRDISDVKFENYPDVFYELVYDTIARDDKKKLIQEFENIHTDNRLTNILLELCDKDYEMSELIEKEKESMTKEEQAEIDSRKAEEILSGRDNE